MVRVWKPGETSQLSNKKSLLLTGNERKLWFCLLVYRINHKAVNMKVEIENTHAPKGMNLVLQRDIITVKERERESVLLRLLKRFWLFEKIVVSFSTAAHVGSLAFFVQA